MTGGGVSRTGESEEEDVALFVDEVGGLESSLERVLYELDRGGAGGGGMSFE